MASHEKTMVAKVSDLSDLGDLKDVTLEGGETAPRRLKDLDDLFPYIGSFGWFQRLLFLMMIPYATFFAFVYFAQIFMTIVPEGHWCFVQELEGLGVEQRRHLSIPLSEDNKFEKCIVYDVNWTQILQDGVQEPNTKWPTKKCAGNWEFNFTDVPYETIATQLNWVCDKDSYASTAQAVFFCGAILGGFIFGWIADKFGRVPALVGSNLAGFLAGVGSAFSNSFWSFCLCRFLVGLAYDNCFVIMYIVVEYVGPKWRTFVANMSIAVYFTFAACMLPFIALACQDWRVYALVTSVPLVLAVFTPCLVPESARWLISQGRIEEALKILKKVERINGKRIPDEIIKEFHETAVEIAKADQECKKYSAVDLFKTPRLRRHSILLVMIWISIAMVFDGHVRNVGSLGLDIFVTFSVATATEFPADILLILVLDVVGRRWLAFGSMVISGIFSLLATTVPIGIPSASLAIVGRFAVNISYNIGMQYAAELLPTVVRAQGLAVIHISGYIATILVPYIVYLATIATYIPLLILGTLGILGGCLCLFLPESTGKDMPQTVQDGEEYGRGQGFWEMPCLNKKGK